ncbi:F-box/WD-40 repeat-containing protein [Acorus calamus]|uniref:F-box/WD-40 repeat-containing protein n=1 Tax=Acorus calamus TaxID=4465 RepID=A0AAV9CYR3_ACOCL|nr:F-box/WD-40 repeat-containing protein [Acorus calamus]
MAFECPVERQDTPEKNYVSDIRGKDVVSKNLKPYIPRGFPRYCPNRDTQSLNVWKPTSKFLPRKKTTTTTEDVRAPLAASDALASNGSSSITDLPPALVSEIFHCLDAKELGIVSCVSTLLHSLASNHQGWRKFYLERWGAPPGPEVQDGGNLWKDLFVERQSRSKAFMAGVTDAFLHCWRSMEGHPHLFDIAGPPDQNFEFRLWEHEGPVTCLALDPCRIYSGSWDMTVRVWDRVQLKCVNVLRHSDWVWALVPRGSTIASSAGRDVYFWDIKTGDSLDVILNAHAGNTCSLARSHSGDLLFTGGEDGAIHMFKVIGSDFKRITTWIPHTGPVLSLAFEFPWLVSSSGDGKLALINMNKLVKPARPLSYSVMTSASVPVEPPQRMLHCAGVKIFSVVIGVDRIICGGDEGMVKIWDFSQALEIEQRVQALRGIRLENRMRRRKVQTEMNGKSGRADQCSVLAKRNQMNGERNGAWHARRGMGLKMKT